MEQEALQQPEMPPAEPRVLPGKRLQEAREARHLSREEVARQLHQDVGIIQALEEDNYAWLPGQTYVLGYLRSYARLMKLPEDEIVAAVQPEQTETAELLPSNLTQRKPIWLNSSGRRRWFPAVLFLLILAALLAVIGFFFPQLTIDLSSLLSFRGQ